MQSYSGRVKEHPNSLKAYMHTLNKNTKHCTATYCKQASLAYMLYVLQVCIHTVPMLGINV